MYRLPDAFDTRARDVTLAAAGGGSTSTTCSSCCIVSAIVGTVVPAQMLAGVRGLHAVDDDASDGAAGRLGKTEPAGAAVPARVDTDVDIGVDALSAASSPVTGAGTGHPLSAPASGMTPRQQRLLGFFMFPLTILCAIAFGVLSGGIGALLALVVPFIVFAKVYESHRLPARDGLIRAAILTVGMSILLVIEVVLWLSVMGLF